MTRKRRDENLFIREVDDKNRDSVVFAKSGSFRLDNNRRTLVLDQGYRYSGTAGKGDFDRVSFEHMELVISTTPKLNTTERHRHAVPTLELIDSTNPEHQAELMWRISLPLTVLVLSLLALGAGGFLFVQGQNVLKNQETAFNQKNRPGRGRRKRKRPNPERKQPQAKRACRRFAADCRRTKRQ